ncbi:MAG TPA: glycosyltransferase [Candidatus Levybacteria bacterium]|nr:glycosyltransferase [Candidatus Levybacteria bacterium]
MRIAFFAESYLPDPNGVATSVAATAAELERQGHTVYIVAPKHPGYKDRKNVIRLYSVKLYTDLDMRTALYLPEPNLIKVLRMKKLDIIHGQDGGVMSLLGWEVANIKNLPFIGTYHTIIHEYTHYLLKGKVFRPGIVKTVTRIFGNMCEQLIAPTERAKQELRKCGVKTPITILPNGIDRARFLNQKKGYLHKRLKISKNTKILLYVGRLGREKSVEFLIKSFQHVLKKEPNTALVLIGGGPDKDVLVELAKKLKVEKKVYLPGFIEQKCMPQVYSDSDIFLFSSKTETQGMAPIEAMTSGLPVVAVQDKTMQELIRDGENGYLTSRNNGDFAKKILLLLKNDEKRDEMGKKAQASTKKYSLAETTKQLVAIYTDFLKIHKKKKASPFRKTVSGAKRILKLLSEPI